MLKTVLVNAIQCHKNYGSLTAVNKFFFQNYLLFLVEIEYHRPHIEGTTLFRIIIVQRLNSIKSRRNCSMSEKPGECTIEACDILDFMASVIGLSVIHPGGFNATRELACM